jgi:hypothetical protein
MPSANRPLNRDLLALLKGGGGSPPRFWGVVNIVTMRLWDDSAMREGRYRSFVQSKCAAIWRDLVKSILVGRMLMFFVVVQSRIPTVCRGHIFRHRQPRWLGRVGVAGKRAKAGFAGKLA